MFLLIFEQLKCPTIFVLEDDQQINLIHIAINTPDPF